MESIDQNNLVVINPDTIEQLKNGSITGVIYFDFGDYQFPEIEWNDFIVVIVGWWIKAVQGLSKNIVDTDSLDFMDGPLQVRITRKDNIFCLVECINNGTRRAVEHSTIVPIDELFSNIVKAGNLVNNICKKNKWHSEDIGLLNKLVYSSQGRRGKSALDL